MITEDYVSFETAKLLKEKGFDAECNYEYGVPVVEQGYVLQMFFKPIKNSELIDEAYAAPTLQMAMKWIREVHNIAIDITGVDIGKPIVGWTYTLFKNIGKFTDIPNVKYSEYDTYEEACEAGIKYVLENLI